MRFASTVRSETNSSPATSRFELAGRRELRDPALGLGQLVAVARPAAAEARDLRARPLRPQRRTELLEHGQRRLQRHARLAPLLGTALHAPEGEQGPRPVERLRDVLVPLQRLGEVGERVLRAALGRRDQPAAAQCRRTAPGASEVPRPGLELRLHGARVIELADEDERLDEVWCDAGDRRLADAHAPLPAMEVAQPTGRGTGVAERQVQEADQGPATDAPSLVAPRRAVGDTRLGLPPGRLDAPAVGVDQRRHEVRFSIGVPEGEAGARLRRAPRVVLRERPPARADLELGELAEGQRLMVRAAALLRLLELGEQQLASRIERSRDPELHGQHLEGSDVAPTVLVPALEPVRAQEQRTLDTLAAHPASEGEVAQHLGEQQRLAAAFRVRNGSLPVPQRSLHVALHDHERRHAVVQVGQQAVVVARLGQRTRHELRPAGVTRQVAKPVQRLGTQRPGGCLLHECAQHVAGAHAVTGGRVRVGRVEHAPRAVGDADRRRQLGCSLPQLAGCSQGSASPGILRGRLQHSGNVLGRSARPRSEMASALLRGGRQRRQPAMNCGPVARRRQLLGRRRQQRVARGARATRARAARATARARDR